MPNFSTRSYEPEIMDDFSIADQGLLQTLRELDFINKWLGGNAITLRALKQLLQKFPQITSVADLGCGSGDMLLQIAQKWPSQFQNLVGYDANEAIVKFAQKHCGSVQAISFEQVDVFSPAFLHKKYDAVLCTLFLHHFKEDDITTLLKALHKNGTKFIIINDLHRHWLAYYSIKWLTALFSKSYMTRYDAKLSVRRGFSKKEWQLILENTGWKHIQIKWRWAFRWEVVLCR